MTLSYYASHEVDLILVENCIAGKLVHTTKKSDIYFNKRRKEILNEYSVIKLRRQ